MSSILAPTPPLDNPFVYGGPVTARNFAGRENELDEILMAAKTGRNAVVYSERRMGKTSILAEFARRHAGDYTFVYLSMRGISDEGQFAEVLARRTLEAYCPRFDEYLSSIVTMVESPGMRLALFDVARFMELAGIRKTEPGEAARDVARELKKCEKCGMPLKWIAEYRRYYCYRCKKYVPTHRIPKYNLEAGFKLMEELTCFECGSQLTYIDHTGDYYCAACRRFPLIERRWTLSHRHRPEEIAKSLDLPERMAEEKGIEAVVMIDDLHEVMTFESQWLLSELASRMAKHVSAHYVLSGSDKDLMRKLFLRRGGQMFRTAHPVDIGALPQEDLQEFLVARFQSGGGKLSKVVAARLTGITRGHPYYAQHLAHELFHISRAPSLADVDKAVARVLDGHALAYSTVWESIRSPLQRRYLIGAACEPGARRGKDFIRRYGLRSRSHVQRVESQLRARGVLDRGDVRDPMLALWLRSLRSSGP